MSVGSYNSVNLTQKQIEFVKLLDYHEIDIFTIETIEKQLGAKVKDLNEILENLVQKKLLARIEKGKFCSYNFKDELVISNYLVKDGVIAYWTALNKHGLTEQFPNIIFVQTAKDKREKKVFGVSYKFVRVAKNRLVGFDIHGYGNHQFRMSDVEKTIVDCFNLPEYSGGYAELIRAFNKTELDAKKMIKYCKAIGNNAVTKRIAYLTEVLQKPNFDTFLKYAKTIVSGKYNLIDPFGNDKGEFVNEWKLRLNISKEDILEICNKMY
jgi:predicted transcriptional regulator of viral defense system